MTSSLAKIGSSKLSTVQSIYKNISSDQGRKTIVKEKTVSCISVVYIYIYIFMISKYKVSLLIGAIFLNPSLKPNSSHLKFGVWKMKFPFGAWG